MSETAEPTDLGIGLALFFGIVAIAGAAGMLVSYEDQVVAAWSFAVAVTAGSLAVAAVHVYGDRDA